MLKYVSRIGIALSVLLNVVLGGPSNQTFSARNWGWKRNKKPNLVWLIDALCDILEIIINKITFTDYKVDFSDHCMTSWIYWRSRRDVIFEQEQNHR
jgi:hypothetical protein